MRNILIAVSIVVLLAGFAGCGSLRHPKAGEFLEQAKGASGIDTQINLTKMIDASITSIQGDKYSEAGLDTLHNQLYALKKASCDVTEAQAKTVAYAKAGTLQKEIRTIFHRLWKAKDNPALRDAHLDLLAKRVQELRETLQAAKG